MDGDPRGPGPRDVLCQHILIAACAGGFYADDLYAEITTCGAYADLCRAEFDDCLAFCATGGYALQRYDRWQRLVEREGCWQLRDPRSASLIRMNLGTIQDTDLLAVRMKGRRGGRPLGEVEEAFAATLTPGDTFLIGGQIVRYEGLREMTVEVSKRGGRKPKIAVFSGTKFSTSTQLSARMLRMFQAGEFSRFPKHTRDWLSLQKSMSRLPEANRILAETFPHDGRHYLCLYGFSGRNAQQTLGLLLTQRMEGLGLAPLGFVSSDYATLIWGLEEVTNPAAVLSAQDLLVVIPT